VIFVRGSPESGVAPDGPPDCMSPNTCIEYNYMFGIKSIIRAIVSNAIALVATSFLLEGFNIDLSFNIILVGAVVLGLVNLFIRPVLKIISFPINIVTLGFFGWLINAILLYLTIYLVEGLTISGGTFSFNYLGIMIPEMYLSWFWTLVVASFSIGIINWILKKILL